MIVMAENYTTPNRGYVLPTRGATPYWDPFKSMMDQIDGEVYGRPEVLGVLGEPNVATPATKYDVSARFVTLRRSNGSTRTMVPGGTLTVDIAVAGPVVNGRDQAGAFGVSSWVNVYYIWNGSVLGLIASSVAPPTGPTLPAGYTHWAYVTSLRIDGSGNLVRLLTHGAWVYYDDDSAIRALSDGTAGTFVVVNCAAFVPPMSRNALLFSTLFLQFSAGAPNARFARIRPAGSSMGNGYAVAGVSVLANGSDYLDTALMLVPLSATQTFEYSLPGSGTIAASRGLYLDIYAYRVPNGDT